MAQPARQAVTGTGPGVAPALLGGLCGRGSRVAAEQAKRMLEVRKLQMDLREREGTLVSAEEVRLTMTEFMQVIVRSVETYPQRGAVAIATALRLDTNGFNLVQSVLDEAVGDLRERMYQELRARFCKAPPEGLGESLLRGAGAASEDPAQGT